MLKKILKSLLVLLLTLVGFVSGLIIGIQIGGNYFTSFTFLGSRGYEATGMIGSWIGLVVFGLLALRLIKPWR